MAEKKIQFPEKLIPLLFGKARYKVAHGGRGSGKCFAPGTKVLMFNGTLKNVEDIRVGDKVMGPDSNPRKVLTLASGESEMFRISQTSADDYIVNADHILSLKKSKSCVNQTGGLMPSGNLKSPRGRYPEYPAVVNIPLKEYIGKSQRWKDNFRGYRAGLIEFPPAPVPVDPYLLGIWLGDGLHRELMITSADEEIVAWMKQYSDSQGLKFTAGGKPGNAARDYRLGRSPEKHGRCNPVWAGFKELKVVSNKHIPQVYISNSRDVRLKLLAGLIDTDGTYARHGYVIVSARRVLAEDIKRLADSLGFRTSITKKKTKCGDYEGVAWSICINGDVWDIPCLIERKKYLHNGILPNKDKTLSYLSIESIGPGRYAGFSVDGDHLFCLADGTVVHNSWSFARALLMHGVAKPLRILCAREIQKSIKDSVHQLLSDQIVALGLEAKYNILQTEITGNNGTRFLFTGLSDQTVDTIKSFEGISVVWIEEGQSITERSWKILIPTIRKEESEIWISFNPDLESDPTYVRFVKTPAPDSIIVEMNWRDNPWFNSVLEAERQDCLTRFPKDYDNIWEGQCRPAVEGAIYFDEVARMERDQRICNVPYDPMLKAHVVFDLGFNDEMAVSIVQKHSSEIRIIRYIEDTQRTLASYSNELKELKYNWGKVWLPFSDGFSKDFKTGKGSDQIMTALGWDVAKKEEVANVDVEEGIRHTRLVFPRFYVDKTHCVQLIESWKRYRRHINKQTLTAGAPVHDQYSHGADNTRYIATNIDQMSNDTGKRMMPMNVASYQPLDSAVGY